jgi:hypothetical protein
MLLFLLHDNFRELPGSAPRVVVESRRDAQALLGAGLFLAFWCVLRLLAASGAGVSFDVALAVVSLCLGVCAALHAIRSLWR